jgi:hypothetical protein
MEETTGMPVTTTIIETDDVITLLRTIKRWREIKSEHSTIVLQVKPNTLKCRLVLSTFPPAYKIQNGWEQHDLGEIFPDMKAI